MQEKVLGKTHPDTVDTIVSMADMYMEGTTDYAKAEEMCRLALDGFEKSLWRITRTRRSVPGAW